LTEVFTALKYSSHLDLSPLKGLSRKLLFESPCKLFMMLVTF